MAPARVLVAALALAGCAPPALSGRALVDGQRDSSGILVFVSGRGFSEDSIVTDAAGAYSFRVQRSDTRCFIHAYATSTKEGERETFIDVGSDDAIAPTLVFTPVGAIDGSVRVGGAPAAGVLVSVEGTDRVASTDAGGRYHLEDVPTGPQIVHVAPSGRPAVDVPQTVAYAQTTTAPPTEL